MEFVEIEIRDGIATVRIMRGKVNALNVAVVDELLEAFRALERDPGTKAIILTGEGRFFSFGFDVPTFLSFDKTSFRMFLVKFTSLYGHLFSFSKPIIAAINGHAIAGGCMLALACDRRIMAAERSTISLNEITFGASVFAGSVEMLRYAVGHRKGAQILYSGAMYTPDEAMSLEIVDEVVDGGILLTRARQVALEMAEKNSAAFASIKELLRGPVADKMRNREEESIDEFMDIWYSELTWAKLQLITINQPERDNHTGEKFEE